MFQDFGAAALAREQGRGGGSLARSPMGSQAEEAASLIGRYPNLEESEVVRLIDVYGRLSALDAALIMSDERLGPKLDRFFDDHSSAISKPLRQYAVLLAIAATGILVTLWAIVIS